MFESLGKSSTSCSTQWRSSCGSKSIALSTGPGTVPNATPSGQPGNFPSIIPLARHLAQGQVPFPATSLPYRSMCFSREGFGIRLMTFRCSETKFWWDDRSFRMIGRRLVIQSESLPSALSPTNRQIFCICYSQSEREFRPSVDLCVLD